MPNITNTQTVVHSLHRGFDGLHPALPRAPTHPAKSGACGYW